jgi:hypothetical protein
MTMTIARAQKGAKKNASQYHVRFRTLLTSQEKELYARVQRGFGRMTAGRERDDAGLIAIENYADDLTALNIERDRSIHSRRNKRRIGSTRSRLLRRSRGMQHHNLFGPSRSAAVDA